MIDELEDLLANFFRVNHTRCFLHINNLVARSLVRQFDVKKVQSTARDNSVVDDNDDPTEVQIQTLAEGLEEEERLHREATLESLESMAAGEDDDDIEGWVDEMAALSQPERELAQRAIRPMQLVLIKVRATTIVDKILLTLFTATTSILQDNTLHHVTSTGMGQMLEDTEPGRASHVSRCSNTVEFNLRHDELCGGVQGGNQ